MLNEQNELSSCFLLTRPSSFSVSDQHSTEYHSLLFISSYFDDFFIIYNFVFDLKIRREINKLFGLCIMVGTPSGRKTIEALGLESNRYTE
jgi:hypothetical protein